MIEELFLKNNTPIHHYMWSSIHPPQNRYSALPNSTLNLEKPFQKRYIGLLIFFMLASFVISLGPAIMFFEENYQIFKHLAFKNSPELISHLNREKMWIFIFLTTIPLASILFCSYYCFRLACRITKPIEELQNHIRSFAKGNLGLLPLKINANHEFNELSEFYNNLYRSIQQENLEDLDLLKKIVIDARNHQSNKILKELISKKSIKLNSVSDFSSKNEIPRDSLHAS